MTEKSCEFCYDGVVCYYERQDGTPARLERVLACSCPAGKLLQHDRRHGSRTTRGIRDWFDEFARHGWKRVPQRLANLADNERRIAANGAGACHPRVVHPESTMLPTNASSFQPAAESIPEKIRKMEEILDGPTQMEGAPEAPETRSTAEPGEDEDVPF